MAEQRNEPEPTKFGAGHLAAMGRLGFKELGNAFVPENSNIVQPGGEYGTFAQPTPGMIAESIEKTDSPSPSPPASQPSGREEPELERE